MTSRRRTYEAFDGLRALAACMVLLYHAGMLTVAWRVYALAPFAWMLKSGVTIFFVISGFLLYRPYARAIRSSASLPDWRRFASRRAIRILPAYWVALTVVALLPLSSGVFGAHWWSYYGLLQSYSSSTWFGGIGVAWSLCVEVAFYLSLPLLAWGVARLVRWWRARDAAWVQLIVIATLALVALVVRLLLADSLNAPITSARYVLATSLPAMMDWFAIGLGLAVVASVWDADRLRFRAIRAMAARPGGCWLVAAMLFIAAALDQRTDQLLVQYGLLTNVALGLAAGLLVLPAIDPDASTKRSLPIRLLCNRRVAWLGTISFGIYLWQLPVLETIFGSINSAASHPPSLAASVLGVAAAATGTVAVAAASWYLVERPASRFVPRALAAVGERLAQRTGRLERSTAATLITISSSAPTKKANHARSLTVPGSLVSPAVKAAISSSTASTTARATKRWRFTTMRER